MNKKEIIAIIDGETRFMDKFEEVLNEEFSFGGKFSIKKILFKAADTKTKRYNVELSNIEDRLALIMVDVVTWEERALKSNATIDLNTTRTIVRDLREKFPDKPIIMVTKYIRDAFLPALSWMSLEDVDGVFAKQYLEKDPEVTKIINFDKKSLIDIIERTTTKRSSYINPSFKYMGEENSKKIIEELFQPDSRSELQIENIGFTVFKNLMERLFLKKIEPNSKKKWVVSYYRQGFSGCYLFKVNGGEKRSWVMKVGDIKKIRTEVKNYSILKNLKKNSIIPENFTEPVQYRNFGAFLIELKEGYQVLKQYYLQNEVKQNIFDNLKGVLKSLYQDTQKENFVRIWKEYYKFKGQTVLKINSFFDNIKKTKWITEKFIPQEKIDKLKDFVKTQGATKEFSERLKNAKIAHIHRDLNATNVLIRPSDYKIVLIDFANYREDHIVKDIAKLETDMIFSVLDSDSENFYSLDRISVWEALFTLFKIGKLFDKKTELSSKDSEIVKIFNFIHNLRMVLQEIYPEINDLEYAAALLYYSFHYLTYPDISIQKKIFGTMLLIKIIDQLN